MTYEQAMRDISEMLPLQEAGERLAAIRARLAAVEAARHDDRRLLEECQYREVRSLAALARAREAVAFFASVIKAGEAWTPTCESALKAALEEP